MSTQTNWIELSENALNTIAPDVSRDQCHGGHEAKGDDRTRTENSVHPWMLEHRNYKNGSPEKAPALSKSQQAKISGFSSSTTKYTQKQLFELEKEFHTTPYLSSSKRTELASRLRLSERQVKVWFQNKRMRTKRHQNAVGYVDRLTEKKKKASQVLHYYNCASSASDRGEENFKDDKFINNLLNNVWLKRLPGKRDRANPTAYGQEGIVDYGACFPVSHVPSGFQSLTQDCLKEVAQSPNSSFELYTCKANDSNKTGCVTTDKYFSNCHDYIEL